jgi:hypothetical protein
VVQEQIQVFQQLHQQVEVVEQEELLVVEHQVDQEEVEVQQVQDHKEVQL